MGGWLTSEIWVPHLRDGFIIAKILSRDPTPGSSKASFIRLSNNLELELFGVVALLGGLSLTVAGL